MNGARMTKEQLKASAVAEINREVIKELQQPGKKKRSKYGNSKTEVDGEIFDSAKEADRYKDLVLLRKAGVIGLLRRQVEYELNPGGTHSLKYLADFVYVIRITGVTVVEDVKGYRTREYLRKKRLMKKVHNIEIQEI